jgi:uncharacterized repeat protein (TIGR01451 family)
MQTNAAKVFRYRSWSQRPRFFAIKIWRIIFTLSLFLSFYTHAIPSSPGDIISGNATLHLSGGVTLIATVDAEVRALGGGEIGLIGEEFELDQLEVDENTLGSDIGSIESSTLGNVDNLIFSTLDSRFFFDGNLLKLNENTSFDFEENQNESLLINISDGLGDQVDRVFDIVITDINDPPTHLEIDGNLVQPATNGEVVGVLTVVDEDVVDNHTFIISDDRFEVTDAKTLKLRDDQSLGIDEKVTLIVTVTDKGGESFSIEVLVVTNPLDIPPTPSALELLQIDLGSSERFNLGFPGCSNQSLEVIPTINPLYSDNVSLPGPVPLVDASVLAIGDIIAVKVREKDKNLNLAELDSIRVQLSADRTADVETVVLIETEVSSGIFIGYVSLGRDSGTTGDCVLNVTTGDRVIARYVDELDEADTSIDSADIASLSRVFDAETGQLLSDQIIVLINADTNLPAVIFGDGPAFAVFPNAISSGSTIRDKAGVNYSFTAGAYRFPIVPAGNYRFELFNSIVYEIFPFEEIDAGLLPPGFNIKPGSKGDIFTFSGGVLGPIDIPLKLIPKIVNEERTTSEIEFFRYSENPPPNGPINFRSSENPAFSGPVNVGPTTCVTGSGEQLIEVTIDGAQPIPVPGIVNLVATPSYRAGQAVFIRVIDLDQNLDPNISELIKVELHVDELNETEFLIIQETGPDTGIFVGYIQSTNADSNNTNDCSLGVSQNISIETRYKDAFNGVDSAEKNILVDPFGVLFDTRTGEPLDGIRVRLFNDDTGQLAEVFGDGPTFGVYPNELISGTGATDSSGKVYEFDKGNYRFPFVAPGNYHLEVDKVPPEFIFPTLKSEEDIQQLPGAPYQLNSGSNGGSFVVAEGPPIQVDLPFDPVVGDVAVVKTGNKSFVAPGDFIQYGISLVNENSGALGEVIVSDTFPKGFRYVSGSLRMDGRPLPDPLHLSARDLQISINTLEASVQLSYVAEVTAGAERGLAVNVANVSGERILSSNTAEFSVRVIEDLFRSKAILVGRVTLDACDADSGIDDNLVKNEGDEQQEKARVSELDNIRLYLEDGTTILTDRDGQWHVEGIEPGTHVVQIDLQTIPDRYQVVGCEGDNSHAGRDYSQFVDLKGGTVWRSDFHLVERPLPEQKITLLQKILSRGEELQVSFSVSKPEKVQLTEAKAAYRIPKGFELVSGSSMINGHAVEPKHSMVGSMYVLDPTIENQVDLRIRPKEKQKPKKEKIEITLKPSFRTRRATLSDKDLKLMYETIHELRQQTVLNIKVTGHSDNVPIAPRNQNEFKSNKSLSLARAQTIADFLMHHLDLDEKYIQINGAGDENPIASNDTVEGRRSNRRVEITIEKELVAERSITENNEPNIQYKDAVSVVRLYYKSAGTAKGRTEPNKVGISQVAEEGGGESAVTATAIGTWDPIEQNLDDIVEDTALNGAEEQGILSFAEGDSLSVRIAGVRLDLDSRLIPQLYLDGELISSDRIGLKQPDDSTGKTLYSYIGIDFGESGDHILALKGVDKEGIEKYSSEVTVIRTGEVAEIRVVDVSKNVADGISPIKVKLQLLDNRGRVIRNLTRLELVDGTLTPYNSEVDRRQFETLVSEIEVSSNGIVRFNPVIKGGLYTARVRFGKIVREIEVFVEPEKRDWILVGLAEGSYAHNVLSGNLENLKTADLGDSVSDGRIAFYAKGVVKGEWLMTIAYDTKKQKNQSLFGTIDPNTYYSVYGDASQQSYDAPSARKLYLRIERNQFNALFGDFNTGLSVTELSRFGRTLNGIQSEFVGKNFKVNGFVSETNQAFIRDDLRGDGTSGLYFLSGNNIVRNTEEIRIETRDRQRNEVIIDGRTLRQFIDYDIDYLAGTIFFKAPVASQDENFNPIFIVAQYETDTDGEEKITAGGRIAYKLDENFSEIGLTVVHDGTDGAETNLAGIDATYFVGQNTEVRAEYAHTNSKDLVSKADGSAYLAEIEHHGDKLQGLIYLRGQDDAFGVGQLSGVESGTQKVGIETEYQLRERVSLVTELYQDIDKKSNDKQTVAEFRYEQQSEDKGYFVGLRSVKDEIGSNTLQTNQVTSGGNIRLLDNRLNLSTAVDTGFGGRGESVDFPTRLLVGGDYRINEKVSIVATQDFSWGGEQDTQNTNAGLRFSPWSGTELSSSVQNASTENGERTFANIGMHQTWKYNDLWAFDFGLDRAQAVREPDAEVRTVNDDVDTPAFGSSSDFSAFSAGANYRKDKWDFFSRVEVRQSDLEDKFNFFAGLQRDLDRGIVVFAKVDVQTTDSPNNGSNLYAIQFATAYRYPESKFTIFDKFDLSLDKQTGSSDSRTRKLINNLSVNYKHDVTTQISLQYGSKYVLDTFGADDYSGYTDLFGAEVRKYLNSKWDVASNVYVLHSWESEVKDFSYGLSFGYLLADNVWVSLGYNFEGFKDEDFSGSEYTSKGLFFKFRMKFDQDTVKALADKEFWPGGRSPEDKSK